MVIASRDVLMFNQVLGIYIIEGTSAKVTFTKKSNEIVNFASGGGRVAWRGDSLWDVTGNHVFRAFQENIKGSERIIQGTSNRFGANSESSKHTSTNN